MPGFDLTQSSYAIYDTVKEYYAMARVELMEELNSDGYKHIIDSVYISDDFQEIQLTFKDGFNVEGQNVFDLFAQGGTLLKDGDAVGIKPSAVVRKYLGKR